MKLVYIAGPFTPTAKQLEARANPGNGWAQRLNAAIDNNMDIGANIERATALALRVAESGHMPVCPHANTGDPRFLSLQTPEFWYAGTLELLRRCDAIALTDDWQESNGACREVIEAARHGFYEWRPEDPHLALMHPAQRMRAEAALHSRGQEP